MRRVDARAPEAVEDELLEQLDGAIGGALLLQDEFLGTMSEVVDERRVGEAAADEGLQFRLITHNYGRFALQEQHHYVAKIPRVGAKRNGSTVAGRLDHVLAATVGQAAT